MLRKYEGWLRMLIILAPMVGGYYDLRYSVQESLRGTEMLSRKIDRVDNDLQERRKVMDQLAIDVAVLKARIR